jgi:deoxycytidylate deaminase
MTTWPDRFFSMAKLVASWSKDPNRQVGCVIARPDNTVASIGYNGFPRGVADTPERWNNNDLKNQLVIHAETNAIINCKDDSMEGYILYCTTFCCCKCSGLIIQKGISAIITPPIEKESSWYSNFLESKTMLNEANVSIYYLPRIN